MRAVLLAVVYYLVVTPIGLLARATRDPLTRSWDPKAESYWVTPAPRGV
ncbi:hypothetical protein G6045_19365 [Streptomyces sp. YC504]|uniref:Uncharacterized protein n=1 Tax=Streptomyces mesophilus TaxID=1775132 RepID=A0A6G4XLV8_9ACTN|nr:hypothetical protein [Streptomyces mesophilus]NGO77800.1 hypothetical protein [Streptomyces mesophilus]